MLTRRRRVLYVFAFFLLISCGDCDSTGEGQNNGANNGPVGEWNPEICDNEEDDDGDGNVDCADPACHVHDACVYEPPSPEDVAPELEATGVTSFYDAYSFLFEGPQPLQRGVDVEAIDRLRLGVGRGFVCDHEGNPIGGVAVSIHDRPEFGRTYTRSDGNFDMAFNAGGEIVFEVRKPGYVPIHRQVKTEKAAAGALEDVVLTPLDEAVTRVDFSEPTVAVSSISTDDDGERKTRVYFPEGVKAELVFPNGATEPLDEMHVRATEVTVGEDGPRAMPAQLPGTSQYTFAADFTVDEALESGASNVRFDRDVYAYVDNFLGFPTGAAVPSGFYDRDEATWEGDSDGYVLEVGSVDGDVAEILVAPDTPAVGVDYDRLGMGDAERRKIAETFEPGDQFWRVPLGHFSPWDFNWAGLFPDGTGPPPGGGGPDDPNCGSSPQERGSILECETQILREQLRLRGTPYWLVYDSGRVPGRVATLTVPLRTDDAPGLGSGKLRKIKAKMEVAGRTFEVEYDGINAPLVHEFTWDGRDVYGREVQGAAVARTTVTNVFESQYTISGNFVVSGSALAPTRQAQTAEAAGSFARVGSSTQSVDIDRAGIRVSRTQVWAVGGWDVEREQLGGWTIDAHHRYDPYRRALHFGGGGDWYSRPDNRKLEVVAGVPLTENAGTPTPAGQPALETQIQGPSDIAVGVDGSVFYAEFNGQIRRVRPDGIVEDLVSPKESFEFIEEESGDGEPAVEAKISQVFDIDVDREGRLLFVSETAVWRVDDDGILHAIAGAGDIPLREFTDGVEASSLDFDSDGYFMRIATGRDGSIYFSSAGEHIYRVMPDGRTYRVAGDPDPSSDCASGPCNEGGRATETQFQIIEDFDVGPDGIIVLAESTGNGDRPQVFRRIRTDGIVETIADVRGDFGNEFDFDLGPNGEIYVATGPFNDAFYGVSIYRLMPDGRQLPFAGSILPEDYRGQMGSGIRSGEPASRYLWGGTDAVGVGPDGTVYFNYSSRIVRVDELLPGYTGRPIEIASRDGQRLFEFDANGRHLATRDVLTGTPIRTFEYDDQMRLVAIADRDGRRTVIERDANGDPTAIVSPYGVRTELSLEDRYITSLTDPSGESWSFDYTDEGLMTGMTNPRGEAWSFDYDDLGRLTEDITPNGGVRGFQRELQALGGHTVTFSSAEGRQTRYGFTTRGQTAATGSSSTSWAVDDDTTRAVAPDGTQLEFEVAGHPIYGRQAAYAGGQRITLPSGLQRDARTTVTAELADTNQPAGLSSWEREVETNGTTRASSWDGSTRTLVYSVGDVDTASTFDDLDRMVTVALPGRLPIDYQYDGDGRVSSVTQGMREWIYDYDDSGFLSAVTRPDGSTVTYARDAAGRITGGTRPDGSMPTFDVDGVGNLVAVTPPGESAWTMEYNAWHSLTQLDMPSGDAFTLDYDLDYRPTLLTLPDGRAISYTYDASGRLTTIGTPTGDLTFDAGGDGGPVTGISYTGGVDVTRKYDGPLLTTETLSGEVNGTVTRTFDEAFRVVSLGIAGVEVPYQYDSSGFLSDAGEARLSRKGGTPFYRSVSIGGVNIRYEFTDYGGLASVQATGPQGDVLSLDYTYDTLGRVESLVEDDAGGTTTQRGYQYDAFGRLIGVNTDGTPSASYTWNDNGRRLAAMTSSETVGSGEIDYDENGQLLQYGTRSYSWNASGQLETITDGGETTNLDYGAMGELLRYEAAAGNTIEYVYDALQRRVGKKVNGTLQRGWLYADGVNPIAELDGSGNVVARFVFGSRPNVPDYMTRNGETYAFVTDRRGSPRYVVNVNTGDVAQRLVYDEFGRVLVDTNPGFQPFGFAGGQYDPDTELTRFGARDYDAATGRWTTIDLLGFFGGQTNLFGYANGDPINNIDPTGTVVQALLAPAAVGGAIGGAAGGLIYAFTADCFSWLGLTGAVVGGAVTGAIIGLGAAIPGAWVAELGTVASLGGGLALGVTTFGPVGGVAGYGAKSAIDPDTEFTTNGTIDAMLDGAAQAALAALGAFFKPADESTGALIKSEATAGLPTSAGYETGKFAGSSNGPEGDCGCD